MLIKDYQIAPLILNVLRILIQSFHQFIYQKIEQIQWCSKL